MIYKFRILSDEVEEFIRVFEIPANLTLYDFHIALQKEMKYDNSQLASFYLSNEKWDKLQEFTLFDLSEEEEHHNTVISMEEAKLGDFLIDKKDRLLYIFDIYSERVLFLELVDKIKQHNKKKNYPVCTYAAGPPPQQICMDNFDFEDMNFNE